MIDSDFNTRTSYLQEIERLIVNCTFCPLYKEHGLAVPGVGNLDADILVCAEAPGFHESDPKQYQGYTGVPMVGPAGSLLQDTLFELGYGQFSFFATNVLKHRPPNNRNPLPEEVTSCSTWLKIQIALVNPKAILAVGKYAINALALLGNTFPPNKIHGQQFYYLDGTPIFTIYHPSYILRNPSAKDGWTSTLRDMLPKLEMLCKQPKH